ncbi:MAG: alpha/beta hydrolase, partial [Alphaproteobacteria bacterium]|nr:alpha/beta hydrolase [Alphaproteobacteria bacterium]
MTKPEPVQEVFIGAGGNRLIADRFGESGNPVLLLHGGGQTRHAWSGTAAALAAQGRVAYSMDQRGHGDSDWDPQGDYRHTAFAADLRLVATELARRHGAQPIAIGASFGGLIALFTEGLAVRDLGEGLFAALVLVDITLRTSDEGADKIRGFMRSKSLEGFASVDEAAEAVAAYMPHRPKPKSNKGLQKNLRQRPDGRWRWHWDPRFMDGEMRIDSDRQAVDPDLVKAAETLSVPTLLVRGASSELVHEEHAQEFLGLAKDAEYLDVA